MRDRLDRAVGSAGEDLQPISQGFDGLMVRTVDDKSRAVQRAQEAAFGADRVQAVMSVDLAVAFDMLAQRAAEIDVEELQAAADADDGLSRAQKFINERKLAFVTRFINVRRAAERATVKARMNVAPAGQQEKICVLGRAYAFRAEERKCVLVIFQAYR